MRVNTRTTRKPPAPALDLVDQLEDQLSIYRDGSEISRLNRTAAREAVPVEPRLYALLDEALSLSRQTDGASTSRQALWRGCGALSSARGPCPSAQAIEQTLEQVGSRHVELDPQALSVRFTRAAVELNLGSIGKGYASIAAGKSWQQRALPTCCCTGARAVCWRGEPVSNRGHPDAWTIGLRNPYRPELRSANSGCATGPWPRRVLERSFSCTRGGATATYWIRAAAGPPPACCRPRLSRPCRPGRRALDRLLRAGARTGRGLLRRAAGDRLCFALPRAGHGSVEIHTAGLTDGQFVTL